MAKLRKSGNTHAAPLSPLHARRSPTIFEATDVPGIVARVNAITIDRPTLLKAGLEAPSDIVEAMIDGLNNAALEYFIAARGDRTGTPAEFRDWSERLAKTAAAFLTALGLDPHQPKTAGTIPLPTYVALCSRSSGLLTERNYPNGFDYKAALDAAAAGALVAHDLANHAASYYQRETETAATVSERQSRARRLSARQGFVWHLGQVFERCFDAKMPRRPNANNSPFLRFARHACVLVSRRMCSPVEPVTQPHDGGDYEAAAALIRAAESNLADDVRAIWRTLDKRRRKGDPVADFLGKIAAK